jgi:hypothetical protein
MMGENQEEISMPSAEFPCLYAFSNGQFVAYYIPAELVDRMRDDLGLLRERIARGEWQQEECVGELSRLLRAFVPKPKYPKQDCEATDGGGDQPVFAVDSGMAIQTGGLQSSAS